MKLKLGSTVTAVVIIFLAVVFVLPSFVTIQTGEIGAVRRFGVVLETLQPGLHFRLWLINDIERYDIMVREVDLDFSAYSIDAQSIRGYVSIQYQLRPHMIITIAEQFGRIHMLESRLHAMMLQETQNVFALKSAMSLVEERATLSHEIRQRLNSIAEQFHVQITAVALEGMHFSAEFDRAVNQRVVAEQELLQAEVDAQRLIINAQRDLEITRLEAEAVLLNARADAEALEIMQGAWGELGLEVRDAMLRQMFFEQWNGMLPQVLTNDNLSIIMDGLSISDER
jgi:regulator of protease activity HflC (stomatin/prohibitin superfamily)